MLHTILSGMVEDLCFQLRTENWLTSNVSVKIKYTNFDTHTKQVSVGHTACDMTIRKIAYKLLENVYQRRMRIRLIGISFSKLVNGRYQINMFDDTEQKIKLYQAMDGIKNRFNPNVIQWGTGFSNLKTDHQVKIENALAESKVEFKSSAHMYESLGGHNKYNN